MVVSVSTATEIGCSGMRSKEKIVCGLPSSKTRTSAWASAAIIFPFLSIGLKKSFTTFGSGASFCACEWSEEKKPQAKKAETSKTRRWVIGYIPPLLGLGKLQGVATFTAGLKRTDAPSRLVRTRSRGPVEEIELEA